MNVEIGIIGGSGLYEMAELTDREEVTLTTPFGDPSAPYVVGTLGGRRVAFLARHGIQAEELTPIREQLRIVRLHLLRLRRSQDDVLVAIAQLREQQTAIGEAVLHMAKHLERLEIMDSIHRRLRQGGSALAAAAGIELVACSGTAAR